MMIVNKFDKFEEINKPKKGKDGFNINDYVIAGISGYEYDSVRNLRYKDYKEYMETTPGKIKTTVSNYFVIKYYNIPPSIRSFFNDVGFAFLSYKPLRLATPEEIERLNIEIYANKYNL